MITVLSTAATRGLNKESHTYKHNSNNLNVKSGITNREKRFLATIPLRNPIFLCTKKKVKTINIVLLFVNEETAHNSYFTNHEIIFHLFNLVSVSYSAI